MATPPPPRWATAAPPLGTAPAITYGKRSRSSHRVSAPPIPTTSTTSTLIKSSDAASPANRADGKHDSPPGGVDGSDGPVLKKPRLSSSTNSPRPRSRIGKPSDPFAFDSEEPAPSPHKSFPARKITLPKSVFPDRNTGPAAACKPTTPRTGHRHASPPKLAPSRSLPTSATTSAIAAVSPPPSLAPPPPPPVATLATEHPAAIDDEDTLSSAACALSSSMGPPDAFDATLSASPLDAEITLSMSPPQPPRALFPLLGDSSSSASSLPASRSNSLPTVAPAPPRLAINPQRDVFLGSFFDDSDEDDGGPAAPMFVPVTDRSVEQKSRPRITRKSSEPMAKENASRFLPDDDEDDEPTTPFEVKARHELREAGEILRLKEELDYLVDGLRSTSVNIRRFSAMDVLRKLSQRTVRRQAIHVVLPVLDALVQDKDAIVLLAFLGVMLALTTDMDAARPLLMDSRFGSLLTHSHALDLVKGLISLSDDKKSKQLVADIKTKLDAFPLPSYLDQDRSPTALWVAAVHALIRFSSELAVTSLSHVGISLVGDLIAWDAPDVTPLHAIALDILERASFYANLASCTLATAFPTARLAPSIAAQYDALRPLPFGLLDADRAVAVARVAALLTTMRVAINVTSEAPAVVHDHFASATTCLVALAEILAGPAPVLVVVADDVRAHVVASCGSAEAASQGSAVASQHAEIWAANAADRADRQVVAVGLLVNIAEHADDAAAYLAGVTVRDAEEEEEGAGIAFPVALDRILADAAVEDEISGVPRVVPLLTAVLLALVLRHAPTTMRAAVDLDRVRSRLQEFIDMHAGLDAAEAADGDGAGSQSQHEHNAALDHHHLVSVTAYADLLREVGSWIST
ncbi:hypothetical protein AMAG_02060 [Allomyces macrogynus ATCC 38327]|uniref:Wings apart-like protein C-terminal domain-containing protein n=1 Tax=Allomyces macrogynus (strain ATCC 38327) TaxID=578462 RepID=A0A0L0S1F8_ALLM3|nr:hypothetical protein AMAG_02060 [Allomyces macrogynus ATCC 38327]|eukprot:KNE56226.1 hypothetical protein AMAG_02060 [Allomyces macrogynus ATCC 38327]